MWNNKYDLQKIILFENKDLLVINKPPGTLSQADGSEEISVLDYLKSRIQQQLFLVNRLDRPVGGCLMVGKKKETQFLFSQPGRTRKTYLAVIPTVDLPVENTLVHYIKRDGRTKKAICLSEPRPGFKDARLKYEIMEVLDNYMVLKIQLITGRFHQIRAQLSHLGAPVKGDVKYGARRANPDRSIDLHSWTLEIPEEKIRIHAPRLDANGLWKSIAIMEKVSILEHLPPQV